MKRSLLNFYKNVVNALFGIYCCRKDSGFWGSGGLTEMNVGEGKKSWDILRQLIEEIVFVWYVRSVRSRKLSFRMSLNIFVEKDGSAGFLCSLQESCMSISTRRTIEKIKMDLVWTKVYRRITHQVTVILYLISKQRRRGTIWYFDVKRRKN